MSQDIIKPELSEIIAVAECIIIAWGQDFEQQFENYLNQMIFKLKAKQNQKCFSAMFLDLTKFYNTI